MIRPTFKNSTLAACFVVYLIGLVVVPVQALQELKDARCIVNTFSSLLCSDNGGNPPATYPTIACVKETFTYTNTVTGTCYDGTCAGNLETIPLASCSDIFDVQVRFCVGDTCKKKRRLQQTHALMSGKAILQDDSKYQGYARNCGHINYNVNLFVTDHFYAIASPKDDGGQEEDANDCPAFVTQATYERSSDTHYHKEMTAMDTQGAKELIDGPNADSLLIGTFKLDDLRIAHESIDPTKQHDDKKAYDVVTNNCADFMISLAKALNIKIDTKIKSYVTRRLLQYAGKDLIDKIRNNVNFGALFGGADRHLLRTTHEPSDEQVIEALVEVRTANHL